jgi:hypothetical protein
MNIGFLHTRGKDIAYFVGEGNMNIGFLHTSRKEIALLGG